MPQRHRDTEIEGQKDRGTEGQREGGNMRSHLSVSLSLCLSVSLSLCLCASVAGSIQKESFEKRAISSAQEMSASDLDKSLPGRPFAGWFNEVVGPNAGVVWQMTECGEPIGVPGEPGYDLPACAEINATLPDGRKVFVAISVGTFKKGPIGKPSFFRAVIEQNEQFYLVRRLRDLPKMLRAPADLSADISATVTKNRIVELPEIKRDSGMAPTHVHFTTLPSSGFLPGAGDSDQSEEPPPPPQ